MLTRDEIPVGGGGMRIDDDGTRSSIQHQSPEPIAIIGASCRLPGAAHDLQKLWALLRDGRSAWSRTPANRFNQAGFHDGNGELKQGTTNTDGGHFLEQDIATFDAAFFGIHATEANAMDPQQRLLLEIAYESFESAGFTLDQLSDSNTGVYVGEWASDYHEMLTRDLDYPPTYLISGTGAAISSNRISYIFNLKGPSFTLDTGCSASLVALHQAVQSLRIGETEQCFVGGVNLIIDPQHYAYQSKLKMFSNEGKSFPFDARANGYGRGEGCSGVVLMPLSLARKQGRPIRAIIRNTAVNQDGYTSGITVPSSAAQSAAIKRAYSEVGLDMCADYVEAHGTGTRTGDPIEAKAIAAVLSVNKGVDGALPIGSIKGNVGHTESAAGLTGLLKAVLMLENNAIPPQANSERPSLSIPLKKLNLRLPQQLEHRPLNRISVNSFGYGGTNAHVIVESAENGMNGHLNLEAASNGHSAHTNGITKPPRQRLFVISGASERSCQSMAASLAEYLKSKSGKEESVLDQLAYTLSRRSIFAHRIGLISSTVDDLERQLKDASTQPPPASNDRVSRRAAFVFSGQGAQYPQMARELLGKWPTFTASLERAATWLSRCGSSWDLIEELSKPSELSRVELPEIAQPMTTAVQLALVDCLRDLGVLPTMVAGHSSGEIAAAYCAGALTFNDAITVSFHRGRLTGELLANLAGGTPGAMLAVGTTSIKVEQVIEGLGDVGHGIKIACYNSPSSVTVSGDADAIDALALKLADEKIFNRKLRTGGAAYHSRQMRLIADGYAVALQDIKASKANSSITMVSSLTGKELGNTLVDRDYWVQNLVSPVLFEQAMTVMCKTQSGFRRIDLILELGPHFQLNGPIKQILRSLGSDVSTIGCSGTLKRGEDSEIRMLDTLRFLYLHNYPVNLHSASSGASDHATLLTDLPPYAFDKSRAYWHESRMSRAYRNRERLPHELLGNLSHENNGVEPQWRCYLRLDEVPWLRGHMVQGEVVFPAAGFISMAVQAAQQDAIYKSKEAIIKEIQLRNISIGNALVLTSGKDDLELYLKLRPQVYSARRSSDLWQEFRIFTVTSSGVWTEHCRGLVHLVLEVGYKPRQSCSPQLKSPTKWRETNIKKFYHLAKDAGLDWMDPFDNLTEIRTTTDSSVAKVTSSTVADLSYGPQGPLYIIHPAVLDSCLFQSLFAVLLLENNVNAPVVPTFIKNLSIRSAEQGKAHLTDMTCHAIRTRDFLTFDVTVVHGEASEIAIQAEGVTATKLPSLSTGTPSERELCHAVDWVAYMSAVTQKWLKETCQSKVERKSIIAQHQKLDALALSYIQPVLTSISRDYIPEGHLRYWFDWMQSCVAQEYDASVLSSALEDNSVGAQALKRVGPHLEELLHGSIHSLSLLTEGDLLSQVYTDERCRRCYKQIARYISELGRLQPGMKILEIGGGTASASLPILEALQHSGRTLASKYDFTDISPAFFTAARTKLAEFGDVIDFKVLNIEKDPVDQGFELGDYDLIIAANIVHATSSIDQSVDHVRSLLRPGGKFILMEITEDLLYLNLVFGTLSGWWAGYDEGRKLSPLLSEQAWSEKLQSLGFRDTEPVFRDHELEDGGTQCVFIADATSAESPAITHGAVDIIPSPKREQQTFVKQLEERMKEVGQVGPASEVDGPGIAILLQPSCELNEEEFVQFQQCITSSRIVLFVSTLTDQLDETLAGEWVTGFCRSLRLEHTDIRFISLLLDGELDVGKVEAIMSVLQSPSMDIVIPDTEVDLEFSERDGQLFVPRIQHLQQMSDYVHGALRRLPPVETRFLDHRPMLVELGTPGLIETIRYTDDFQALSSLGAEEVKLQLCAASVNFKEVLIASGQLEGITSMVNDCSGIILEVGKDMQHRYKPGDRVCALEARSYANYPIIHGDLIHRIPNDMDFDTAAAIPVVWITVFYSLVDCGRLQRGDKILIHSAAGAVGQAAVMFAKHIGTEVFVTCSNDAKRKLLNEQFGIPYDHIFSSRTAAFREEILSLTSGYGVDVVLNSLGGDLLRESCNTVAPFGRFVEIGRKDLMEDALLPLEFMLRNVTFSYVDMARITATRKQLTQRLLRDTMDLFATGAVESVMLTKMPISHISDAFRFIQAGKHVGKVVLTVEPNQHVKAIPPRSPPPTLDSNATYLVTGGLGGLGKRIITHLASRGARTIVSLSRSGTIDAEAASLLTSLRATGVNVYVKSCDISSAPSLTRTLSELVMEGLPPIRGLIQSAMVLEDSLFADMTPAQWTAAMWPKVAGTLNLHTHLPADMSFFITLSSAVAIAGNVGQSNYAAACSFQDGFARYRRRMGLCGSSINVGAISEVGFVSENPEVSVALRRKGLGSVSVADFVAHLDDVIIRELGRGEGEHGKEGMGGWGLELGLEQSAIGLIPAGDELGLGPATWMNDRKYVLLAPQSSIHTSASSGSASLDSALSTATTLPEATSIACRAIINQLGTIIGLPSENMSAERSLDSYGVDSLVAVELRNWINIHLKANLSLLTVRSSGSIRELASSVVRESRLVGGEVKGG